MTSTLSESFQLERAIHANPADIAPKLVYADWLEERDNPLGKCLRDVAQCESGDFANGNNPLAEHDAITLMEACQLVFPSIDRIDRLSEKQSAMLSSFRDSWLRVGLSCGGYDLENVKSLISQAYQVAGLNPPEVFIELPSPLHGTIGSWILKNSSQVRNQVRGQVRDQVGDQVRNQVGSQVWNQVREQVRGQVWEKAGNQVGNQVGSQVLGQVWEKVWDQVGNQVWEKVWDQVWEKVGDKVWNQVGNKMRNQVGYQVVGDQNNIEQILKQRWLALYGLHDAGWLSFYSVFAAYGIKDSERLIPLMKLATQIGWWWPFENAVIITPRPKSITMDGNKLVEVSWQEFTVKGE